jgi:chromate transporter
MVSLSGCINLKQAWFVFLTSLRLGLTSFGGPIAHLGYFEYTYVKKKQWLSHEEYSHMVALCQLLPGPTSSQVNFLIGLQKAGWLGAILSWIGFTLPSAALLYAFALLAPKAHGPLMDATIHGLKLVAVAIVAQAVWSMAVRLCPDRSRAGIALAGMAVLLLIGGASAQIFVIVLGAMVGWWLCREVGAASANQPSPVGKRVALISCTLFFVFLVGLPTMNFMLPSGFTHLIDVSYRSGALVFGGGHVVLPLLRDAMVPTGMITDDAFLAGYGMAQAVPGPLFTLSAYLGAMATPAGETTLLWSLAALVFIFLPGMLTALAGIPLWQWLSKHPSARGALAGINAAVVGILGAALYDPVWKTAILETTDVIIAVTSLFLLERWKIPPILIVALCVIASISIRILRSI